MNGDYTQRIKNMQPRPASMIVGSVSAYNQGYAEAREEALKIVEEACEQFETNSAALVAAAYENAARRCGYAKDHERAPMVRGFDEAFSAAARHLESTIRAKTPKDAEYTLSKLMEQAAENAYERGVRDVQNGDEDFKSLSKKMADQLDEMSRESDLEVCYSMAIDALDMHTEYLALLPHKDTKNAEHREDIVKRVAKALNGPNDPTHIGHDKLRELQDYKWENQTTRRQRKELLSDARVAAAAIDMTRVPVPKGDKHNEALDWIIKNQTAIRRDNGDMDL